MSRLAAVIWDFDGTLADTRERNLRVTRRIVREVLELRPDRYPALADLRAYDEANRRCANWRELYRDVFGVDEEETDRAGSVWAEYQLADEGPTPLIPGVAEAVEALAHHPQGIVSLNSRENILTVLEAAGVAERFGSVVGYEEVDLRRQKPDPDALLRCLEQLAVSRGDVLYVGDHETDVRCVRNANRVLEEDDRSVRVVATAARFTPATDTAAWAVEPDHRADHPEEVVRLARRYASAPREGSR